MNNPLTPVEALQHEIDTYMLRSTLEQTMRIYVAALELAKVDAELIAHDAAEPKHPNPNVIWGSWHEENWVPWRTKRDEIVTSIQSARENLYEAVQR